MMAADLLAASEAMAVYARAEDRLREEARKLDRAGCPAYAREVRKSMLVAHKALVNEDRNDDSHEGRPHAPYRYYSEDRG